jgi:type II secretory pathway component PulJ
MVTLTQGRTKRAGYLLTEGIAALALLGLLLFFVARFERQAAATARRLEREYVATAAAESQFERLKAGLPVLNPAAFRQRYPGLTLDYQVRPAGPSGEAVGVVTVTGRDAGSPVLVKLAGPVPSPVQPAGARQ